MRNEKFYSGLKLAQQIKHYSRFISYTHAVFLLRSTKMMRLERRVLSMKNGLLFFWETIKAHC